MAELRHYLDIIRFRRPIWMDTDSVVYISNQGGVDQLWRKDKGEEPVQLTYNENYIGSYLVDHSSQTIYYTLSEGGDEKFQIYALRNQQSEKISASNNEVNYLGSLRHDGQELVYTSNARDFEHFDLVTYHTATGQRSIKIENHDHYNFPVSLSPNDRYFIYQKLFSEDDQPLWLYDFEAEEAEALFDKQGAYDKAVWKKDSSGFYFLTNLESNFIYLADYDLKTKAMTKLLDFPWDVENLSLSPDGRYLALIINDNGRSVLKIYETASMQEREISGQAQGVMAYYDSLEWDAASKRLLFVFSSGSQPDQIMYYSLDDGLFHQIQSNKLHPSIQYLTVEPLLKHFESFDGLKVPYWLYLPKGIESIPPEGLPLMIEIHGGPEAQERADFNEYIQYFLSHGIAIAAPNVRGSTGYGKEYTAMDNIEKRLDSVKDIEWLVKDLRENKIAHPDKIVVSGTSYGGFMALSSAGRYSDLFCGAVDNVGMFNLVSFLENTSSYRRAHRETEYGSLEDDRESLYKVSPIAVVDQIKTPLMVIHGANDARVPVDEAEQVVDNLRQRQIPVEYLRYEDEGHGLQKRKNKLDCYPQIIAFVKQCMHI